MPRSRDARAWSRAKNAFNEMNAFPWSGEQTPNVDKSVPIDLHEFARMITRKSSATLFAGGNPSHGSTCIRSLDVLVFCIRARVRRRLQSDGTEWGRRSALRGKW